MSWPIYLLAAATICAVAIMASTTSGLALQPCRGDCESALKGDCEGELACIESKRKLVSASRNCKPSGYLKGRSHSCSHEGSSECCKAGERYPQFKCSPPITARTPAIMTVNCFGEGSCGGGPAECDGQFHSDNEKIAALSTGWYAKGKYCGKKIRIHGNGKSTLATIVDECDSVNGCDAEHAYQPPCRNDDVDVSPAVWRALGVSEDDPNYGSMHVTWTVA